MKRVAHPVLSKSGERALTRYDQSLSIEEDQSPVTIRNYLSDLRQFAARRELIWWDGCEEIASFASEALSTPTLIDYRMYLQQTLHLKPNSVNRSFISLKGHFTWLVISAQLSYDPVKVVKLGREEIIPQHHLDDQEEQALVAAVTRAGNPHDMRHRFGYRMATSVPIHRLAQLMGHDSLDATLIYVQRTKSDLQREIEKIAWI